MRPVKLIDPDGRFLADGAAADLSPRGARIRHFGAEVFEERLDLFDAVETTNRPALVVWQRGDFLGLRFCGPVRAASRADVVRLTGRYYALED